MTGPALIGCAGFLLAVLWMDLMFDSQTRSGGRVLDEAILASICGYYHRATVTSQPRGALVAAVMAVMAALLAGEAVTGSSPGWLLAVSAPLAGGPILLAALRTVPNAVRLGRRTGDAAEQSALARAVYRDHLICLTGMLAFLALWLREALVWKN